MKLGGKVFQKEIYICSLSESANNSDLWDRYANSYRGFCIEYSIFSLVMKGLCPIPAVYGNIQRNITSFAGSGKAEILFDIILKKDAKRWSQQDEWRVFKWYTQLGLNIGDKGVLVDAPIPTAIYFGKLASPELIEKLKGYADSINIPLIGIG